MEQVWNNWLGQGLANSGYAESTKTALYNTYQKSVTDTLNNSKDLYADYNFKIQQARQNGSIQQAQSALELYSQRLQLLTQNYELRQNREQYLYQQERDRISDQQWQRTFDEQVRQNEIENQWKQKSFDYQRQRDAVADSQWQQQFNLSKKKASSASSKKKSANNKLQVADTNNASNVSKEEVIKNMKVLAGPNLQNHIKDGISGKTFSSPDALLNYYGYAIAK